MSLQHGQGRAQLRRQKRMEQARGRRAALLSGRHYGSDAEALAWAPAMTSHNVKPCRWCGSDRLEWVPDEGWFTGSVRRLWCVACGDVQRTVAGASTWIMFAIAAAAAFAGWFAVLR